MKQAILTIIIASLLAACTSRKVEFDSSGSFEAEEIIISAEASGLVRVLEAEEGSTLAVGQYIGYIDSTQAFLKKKRINAQIAAVESRKPDIGAQLASLLVQTEAARREQKRISSLVQADAATPKQLDDANAQVAVLEKQIAALRSSLEISTASIASEARPLQVDESQASDQLSKYSLINPVQGTVLTKYAQAGELAIAGKPLYKIADLSYLWMRAYLPASRLNEIRPGQKVKVFTDAGDKEYKEQDGTVTWISDKAEFTPKTIQTKEERASTVYAFRIKVKNDGSLKIGMYGEVKF